MTLTVNWNTLEFLIVLYPAWLWQSGCAIVMVNSGSRNPAQKAVAIDSTSNVVWFDSGVLLKLNFNLL